jgi:hypothetical protein
MIRRSFYPLIAILLILAFGTGIALGATLAEPMGAGALQSTFSYQGYLEDGSGPITDTCDLEFTLWDDLSAGAQIPPTVTKTGVSVTDGQFSVMLDFGLGAFDGEDRYLEIGVKCTGDSAFTSLSPRQPLTPVPYAMFAMDTTPLENILTVASSGGDFQTIQSAIDHAVAQGAGPTQRFLVYVAPGFYHEQVTMAPYVDLQGSGINMTKLQWHGSSTPDSGTLIGAGTSQVSHMFIENYGGDAYAIGVFNETVTQAKYLHVKVHARDGSSGTYAFLSDGASGETYVKLEHVKALTSGSPILRTIYFQGGAYGDIAHTDIDASSEDPSADVIGLGMTQNNSRDAWLNTIFIGANATAAGSGAKGIWLSDNSSNLYIDGMHCHADGAESGDGIYLENSGLIMSNVKTIGDSASGIATGIRSISSGVEVRSAFINSRGAIGYGIYSNESDAKFRDLGIQTETSGAGDAQGIHSEGASNIQMDGVDIWAVCPDCTATGIWNQGGNSFFVEGGDTLAESTTGDAYGIQLDGARADLNDVRIRASGATTYGITAMDSSGSSLVKIYHSVIGFFTNAVDISGSSTNVYIANSMLAGSILTDGLATYNCIQIYDGALNPVSCP